MLESLCVVNVPRIYLFFKKKLLSCCLCILASHSVTSRHCPRIWSQHESTVLYYMPLWPQTDVLTGSIWPFCVKHILIAYVKSLLADRNRR